MQIEFGPGGSSASCHKWAALEDWPMMVRRSFGTIHAGHLPEDFDGVQHTLDSYFYTLQEACTVNTLQSKGYTAGAFALEEGSETQRKHIQFYVEHSRKRPSTLAKDFGLTTGAVFDRVRDARGAWDYCTASGTHEGKEGVIDSFTFGTPKLHGDTQKADLKLMVSLILDGMTPAAILKEYPYAYTVHRRRIWNLYKDLNNSNYDEELWTQHMMREGR